MKSIFHTLALAVAIALMASSYAFAQELINPIPIGEEGKLTVEEMKSGAMPHWMPHYGNGVAEYKDYDFVVVAYSTDEENVTALLPEGLNSIDIPFLPGQAPVNLVFAKYREVDILGPYLEVVVTLPVVIDGLPYLYVPAIYVDNDEAMTAGREYGGYPKKFADIELDTYGEWFLGKMARPSRSLKTSDPTFSDVVSVSVRKGGRLLSIPLPAEKIDPLPFPYGDLLPLPKATGKPQLLTLATIGLRSLPGVGEEPWGNADVLQLIASPWVTTDGEVYEGLEPTLDFQPRNEDPIAQALPVNGVLAAYIIRGTMHTDPSKWFLIKDYLKK